MFALPLLICNLFLIIGVVIVSPLTGAEMPIQKSLLLVDISGHPTKPLLELLELFDVKHDGTLSSIVEATQKLWYQAGKERWEFEVRYPDKLDAAIPLLKKLGYIDEVSASRSHYKYALLLGGYTMRMQERIECLIKEWNRGVRFDQIVVLTGQRPLDSKTEGHIEGIETETQMLMHLFSNADLPNLLRSIPVLLVDVPMREKRPTTLDTINAWMRFNPEAGSCLILANQPFVNYFDLVFRTYMPTDFDLECVGNRARVKDESALGCSLFIDNLARCLYTELGSKPGKYRGN